MSNYNWCHGPRCHTYATQDRVRGNKGNKVLKTRKIVHNNWNVGYWSQYFCSQSCFHVFMNTHLDRVIALAPRREPLETPIEDPEKVEQKGWGGRIFYNTQITKKS